jgi:hypothetical protein
MGNSLSRPWNIVSFMGLIRHGTVYRSGLRPGFRDSIGSFWVEYRRRWSDSSFRLMAAFGHLLRGRSGLVRGAERRADFAKVAVNRAAPVPATDPARRQQAAFAAPLNGPASRGSRVGRKYTLRQDDFLLFFFDTLP